MKRAMTGIALAAAGIVVSAGLAPAASASTARPATQGTAQFTNWFECENTGNQWIAQGRIKDFQCYSSGTTIPGGPNAYMVYDY